MSVGRSSSQITNRVASLSDIDHEILCLLHVHRVLTTPQLIALTGRPERTVDYRLARLRERSLAARTRPYAASGSAPYYWWLTRAGARLVDGTSPAPGKGEPNPLFLRHTAATAGLYVALLDVGPDAGLMLTSWHRDEESWEDWDHLGHPGRIRPDAFVEVQLEVDGEPASAGAFIEVDFATMDQARLRAKVARHRRYVNETIWWDRHPCCPALLLVTTSEARVSRFLAGVEKNRPQRNPYEKDHPARYDELVAACAAVASPEAAVASPVWRAGVDDAPCTLSALLMAEVRQYRQVVARVKTAWRAEDDALRRSAAWDLARDADDIASALGDAEAAGALRYLLGHKSSGHHDWVDEHPDLADATLAWWREAKVNDALAPVPLVDAWRSVGRACWLEQVERLLAQHEALALGDPLLRRSAEALGSGDLVADYELQRTEPIDGRATVARAMAEHERRREVAVTAELQTLPLHRRLLASRAELEAAYDARHLCVCPRCGVPRNNDEDPGISGYHGVRCRCCGGQVVPVVEAPVLPAELDDSIARITDRRERLRGER
ncbi:MAG: replication-relaxation family protein [Actinomycetota bacterium]|nr:replication-relaxation family protein [Actinomycetota bacterium]